MIDITSNEFKVILQYCEHHNFIRPPEIVRPLAKDISLCVSDRWDIDFITSFDFGQTVNILIVADKLKCTSLMDLCYTKLALNIRSKYEYS
jgi:hypothetical protein